MAGRSRAMGNNNTKHDTHHSQPQLGSTTHRRHGQTGRHQQDETVRLHCTAQHPYDQNGRQVERWCTNGRHVWVCTHRRWRYQRLACLQCGYKPCHAELRLHLQHGRTGHATHPGIGAEISIALPVRKKDYQSIQRQRTSWHRHGLRH